ncbi:hypothetical protein ABEB36_015540 [Hypothenemus hampei]|uniref:Uncharacterized protein n=1 Tax=Hypothenemus hampei TaxID=57062 RepID=A0ABD1DZP5_HYPHA
MSSKKPTGPRAGPSEAGESRTVSTPDPVCPTGYGGGNSASKIESNRVTSNIGTNIQSHTSDNTTGCDTQSENEAVSGFQDNQSHKQFFVTPKNPEDEEVDECEFIAKLVRSRPKKRSKHKQELNQTICNIESDLTSEDDASSGANKKRPRETTPTQNDMAKRSNQGSRPGNQKVIEDMCIKIELLEKIIQRAHKPKGEIKNAILELSRTAKNIMKTRAGFSPKTVHQSGPCNCSVELEKLRRENAELKVGLGDLEDAMLDMQKSSGSDNSLIAAKKETINIIKRTLDEQVKSKKGLENIIELTWVPSCFRVTKMRWPDGIHGDMLYILEEGNLQPTELDRIFGRRSEVRSAVNKIKNTTVNFITIKNNSSIVIGDEEEENTTKRIHIIVNPTQQLLRTDNMIKLLRRVKQIHQREGSGGPIKLYDATCLISKLNHKTLYFTRAGYSL